jgi:effector-binding domain-containing protein
MKVGLKVKVDPGYNVAYMIHYGPYTGQNMWRSEFNQLVKWTKKRKLRTGKWIMYFIDKWSEKSQKKRRSVAAIEIKGKAKPDGKIQIMRIPRQKVVSVMFDPDKVSEELVYHGLDSWLESSSYKQAARSRELYDGNPWTNRRAWANCEVQVPLKRK